MGRRLRVLGAVLLLSAGAATPAWSASWAFETDPPRVILADGDEDVDFLASCEGGILQIIYMAPDRTKLTSGTKAACESERPCREKVPVTLLVDGKATQIEARAQPEEMYGGYELHFTLAPQHPFWTLMAGGKALSMKIDGKVGEKLPLKGVAKPLGKLLAACKG